MIKDLTVGKPDKVIFKFCLPLFASVIFQQLYNIADSFVAGKFVSEEALAAVGNSYEITLFFIAFAFGCNMGCSVIVSQYFGAKKYSKLKTTVYTSLIATLTVCAVLMVVGLGLGFNLLKVMNTPESILSLSFSYLRIYTLCLPFVMLYNVANGIFTALGDSKTPFFLLMFSSLANIAVDVLFVTKLSFLFSNGVVAVALATFICQSISSIVSVVIIFIRLKSIKADVNEKVKLFDRDILKKFLIIAIPSTLQQSFISVGNIIIQGFINVYGATVIAGYSAAVKLNNMIITAIVTFGNGVSNFTAQNYGAGKSNRIRSGRISGIKVALFPVIPASVIYFIFGKNLVFLFLNNPLSGAAEVGKVFLCILAPFYFVVILKIVTDSVMRGMGLMLPFMISTFTDIFLRVVLAGLFSRWWGSNGIWMSWPFGWIVATVLSLIFYKIYVGKKIKQ